MSNLKVQTKSLDNKATSILHKASDIGKLHSKLMDIRYAIDYEVKCRQGIEGSINQCLQELNHIENATDALAGFILHSVTAYSNAEERLLTMFDQLDEETLNEEKTHRTASRSTEDTFGPRRYFKRVPLFDDDNLYEISPDEDTSNKRYTDQEIIDLKKAMKDMFTDHPEVEIPVENSNGVIDARIDNDFDETVTWFLRNYSAYFRSGYLEFTYEALPEEYRLMVLMHWIELMKEGIQLNQGNILPEEYFESIPPVPFMDKKLGNITPENKYTSEDALEYFKKYYYPIDALYEINHNNFPEEIKEVHFSQWARFTYGSSKKEEKEEFGFGLFFGLAVSPLKGVMDTIEGIYSVCTNYEQILPLLSFMASVPFSFEKQKLLAQMIDEAIEEWKLAYDGAEPSEKGRMIGSLIGETIMIAIEAGAAVKSVAGLTKFIKNGGFKKTFKQVLKMGSGLKKILKMTPDELLTAVKKVTKLDNGYEFIMLDDEIIHVPFDDLNMMQRSKFDGLVDTHPKKDIVPDRIDGEDAIDLMIDGARGNTKFSRDQLDYLKSFKESKKFSELLSTHNITETELHVIIMTKVDDLTDAEKVAIKAFRDAVPDPTSDTLLQKVISINDIDNYLKEVDPYTEIGGCVAKAEDVKHLSNPADVYDSLRLDYPGTSFFKDGDYAVIRFKTDEVSKLDIPYSNKISNVSAKPNISYPQTGNGFTSARDGSLIPEFEASIYMKPKDGAELYKVSDGIEELVGVYDGKKKRFVPVSAN